MKLFERSDISLKNFNPYKTTPKTEVITPKTEVI